jgi:hypothetical protein
MIQKVHTWEGLFEAQVDRAMLPPKRPSLAVQQDNGLFCSFCSKHDSEVKVMIVNGDIVICDECVDACVAIVRKRMAQ